MNLKTLSNETLDQNLKLLTQREREILSDILLHVCEVDRRKLFLDLAYPNLFAYMTEHLGYSAGSAQRRIDAARLSKEVPAIVESLESGSLNLSQVSILQKAVRQIFKTSQQKVTSAQKHEVLNQLVGKSFEESQIIVARSFDIEIQTSPKIQHQANESVRLEISFSKEQWAKLEEMRTLLSHSMPDGSWESTFEYIADKVIQQKGKTSKRTTPQISKQKPLVEKKQCGSEQPQQTAKLQLNSTASVSCSTDRSYISLEIIRQVFQRDTCCQYVSSKNKKICGSKWHLQTDHIKPIWAGGDNSLQNLQLLCANHNQARYKKQSRIRPIYVSWPLLIDLKKRYGVLFPPYLFSGLLLRPSANN